MVLQRPKEVECRTESVPSCTVGAGNHPPPNPPMSLRASHSERCMSLNSAKKQKATPPLSGPRRVLVSMRGMARPLSVDHSRTV